MTAPPKHPYDPGDPYPDHAFDGDCALLVLLASRSADSNWSTRCAISLAKQWADHGERVFLADLAFRKPRLHQQLGQPNGEGVSDVFLYGASLRRVARAAPEGFFFAPAGTPVPDGGRVLSSSRWGLLTQGFARAGARLVVYLPVDEPGASEVLGHAERVLLLAGADATDVLDASKGVRDRVGAVLSPRRGYQPPTVVFETEGATRAAAAAPPRVTFGGLGKKSTASSARMRQVLLGGGILLALVIVAGGLGWIPMPWSSGAGAPAGEGAAPVTNGAGAGTAAAGAGAAVPDPMGSYFLTLSSYAEREVAELQAQTLGGAHADLLFVVSPVEVNGQVLFRLMAGVALDSTAASLRASLLRTLSSEDPATWQARPGALSFHLGSFPTLEAARARVSELDGRGVPAYVLRQVADSTTQLVFDVWAGAYADEAEAAYLRASLDVQGIVPILRPRTGQLVTQAPR